MNDIKTLLILFFIYSIFGWLIEMSWTTIISRKSSNRGFLIGPYCPIYGFSSIFMVIFLTKYIEDLVVVFIIAAVICSIFEYFTSYIMEKIFKARWWDYSKRRMNLNGRICLENAVAFGLLGVVLVGLLNPLVLEVISKINIDVLNIVTIVFSILFIIDNIISFNIISSFKNVGFEITKDSTIEISNKVKEIIYKRGILFKRVLKAFPDFKMNLKIRNKKED